MTKLRLRGRKRERILRVLLNEPDGSLTRRKIAKFSECSREWVIEFLSKLEAEGMVKQTKVLEYEKLVQYWSQVRLEPLHRDYMLRTPLELLRKTELRYAMTTYQAENLVQHYVFPSRTDFYILEEDRMRWHDLIVTEGGLVGEGNTRVLLGDNHVFYKARKLQELTVVSLPQLVVDLITEGGPCLEAAQLLLKKVNRHHVPTS